MRDTPTMVVYPLFDLLRIALAISVVISHSEVIETLALANISVEVFFCLSGFLIGSILIKTPFHELPRFYFNRVTRVWVPFFFAILIIYIASLVKDGYAYNLFPSFLYDVTFTHNIFISPYLGSTHAIDLPLGGAANHVWSISVEEQFYLLSPIILAATCGAIRSAFWGLITIVAIFSESQFGSIALGVLAAIHFQAIEPMYRRRGSRLCLAAAALILFPLAMSESVRLPLVAPFLSVAIILLAAVPGKRTALTSFLGGISYPVYLNHGIVARLIDHAAVATGFELSPAESLIKIVAGIAAGALAYLAIDRPVMSRRGAFYSPKRGKALAASAYLLFGVGLCVGAWNAF
jgi:peptidoglycan/LPS O-acetylase OafA/YrhL